MSPHQTATKIVAKFLGCPEEQAAGGQLASQICDAILAASNEEMSRRRERVAEMEAALKAHSNTVKYLLSVHGFSSSPKGALERLGILENADKNLEAALSGSASALDVVVAQATAKLTEERDALAAGVGELRDAVAAVIREDPFSGINADWAQCCLGTAMDGTEDLTALVAARDARIRAEGRKAGLEEAADILATMGQITPLIVVELRQLAAQAGEGSNAD